MIKFFGDKGDGGTLYGFGFTKANLRRMSGSKREAVFFDFGYAQAPELFGLILYLADFRRAEDIANHMTAVAEAAMPFLNEERGVTLDTLRIFPFARNVMEKFQSTPYWGFETYMPIRNPNDMQTFFAGPDQESIERHFEQAGFITAETKRTRRGFG